MSYRRNHTKNKIILIICAIVAGGIVLYTVGGTFSRFASESITSALAPILRDGNLIFQEAGLFSSSIFLSKKRLLEDKEALEYENAELELRLLSKDILLKENNDLKKMLGRDPVENMVLAAVITRPNHSPYDTIVVDTGSDMVGIGDKAFVFGAFVVGEVSRVFENTSIVKLYSSPGVKNDVLLGERSIASEAIGRGAQNFEIMLPRDTGVMEGDAALMPGLNMELLGVVSYVDKNPNNSFERILLRSPFNINMLRWVQIKSSVKNDIVYDAQNNDI